MAFVRLQNLVSVLHLNATFVRCVLDQRSSLFPIQYLYLFVSDTFSILERLASCSNLKHLRRRCSNRARRRCLSRKVLFFVVVVVLFRSKKKTKKEFLKPPDKHRAAEGTIRWYEVDVVVAPSISLVARHILRKEEESARRIFTCKVRKCVKLLPFW